MVKKSVAMLCIGVFVSLMLAGCGGGGKGETKDDGGGNKTEAEVTINIMWQQDSTEQFWDLPLEKFREKHPNVKVEFDCNPKAVEVIRNLLNVGQAPDIFYTWISDVDYYGFAREGLLYPVDDILKEQNAEGTATLADTVFSAGLELGELDGAHYFLPTCKLIAGNFYDGTLFSEHNWEAPSTWEEFMSLCESIRAEEITPMVYAGAYPFYVADAFFVPMIQNIDPAAMEAINNNEEGAWLNPAVVKAVGRLEEMRNAGYIDKNSLAMDHIQSQIDFIGNKDAFIPCGSWLEGEMAGQWPDEFKLTPLFAPGEGDGKTSATAVVECMILPKQEDESKLEYVKELIQLFYSVENAKYVAENTGIMPGIEAQNEDVMQLLPESVRTMWEMADENVTIISPSYKVRYKEILAEMNNCINALIQEEINASEFCERMDAKAREVESNKQ